MFDFLELRLANNFEKQLLNAAIQNLTETGNALRINNFAYALRSLLDVILDRTSPTEKVKACSWYVARTQTQLNSGMREVNLIEKIKYALQGGLGDDCIIFDKVNLHAETTELKNLHYKLSSYTHINVGTFPIHLNAQEETIAKIVKTLNDFWKRFDIIRRSILKAINNQLIENAIEERLTDQFPQALLDMGVGYVDSPEINNYKICSIEPDFIHIDIFGTANCEHHLGGKRDGIELPGSYPFKVKLKVFTSDLNKFLIDWSHLKFDVTSWYDVDIYGYQHE